LFNDGVEARNDLFFKGNIDLRRRNFAAEYFEFFLSGRILLGIASPDHYAAALFGDAACET
jgi:hypothetical protein